MQALLPGICTNCGMRMDLTVSMRAFTSLSFSALLYRLMIVYRWYWLLHRHHFRCSMQTGICTIIDLSIIHIIILYTYKNNFGCSIQTAVCLSILLVAHVKAHLQLLYTDCYLPMNITGSTSTTTIPGAVYRLLFACGS